MKAKRRRPPREKPQVWFIDDRRAVRTNADVGESIYVTGRGFRPVTNYEFYLRSRERRPELLARLTTDRHGALPPSLLVPYLGLIGRGRVNDVFATFEGAEQRLGGRTLAFDVRGRPSGTVASLALGVNKRGEKPQVSACDKRGRLVTGFVAGREDVDIALRNFPAGCVRVFMVHRQHDWHVGDPIQPIRDANGSPIEVSTRLEQDGRAILHVWPRDRARPGSYQFIARSFRPGWYDSDDMHLLAGDVVSARWMSSLVIRRLPDLFGISDDGPILTPRLAGVPYHSAPPYFEFLNNFPKGTDVWAALDPGALPATVVTQKAALYTIVHKSAAQWAASSTLNDISGPGMTAAPKIVPIVQGCINWNETLVWPDPQTTGQYDIVVDFGNNAANPANFAPDGSFDPPLDMIDGYVRVGFYVTDDPSVPGPYAGGVGQHSYDNGSVQVPSTDAGPTPTEALELKAVIRYPAQANGVDTAFQPGAFPLVVIVHGNSGMDTSYLGYNYLLDHLAGQGFVAMSIYAPVGTMIETRARAIFEHLKIMSQNNTNPGLFQGHIDFTQIGIMGHSRGGEAVVRAARINTAEALGWNLRAGIALAPTDFFRYGDPGFPLVVIYGANDGDVSGSWPNFTGFDVYDEAGEPRSFVFVYAATHDRFNSEWASIEATTELTWDIAPSDIPKLISETDHQNVAKGYVTAFYQLHLMGRTEQVEYFTGALKPSLVASVEIHTSHQEPGGIMVDDFAQANPAVNTLGGTVTATALPAAPAENQLHTLDGHSPHTTTGGDISWNSALGIYLTSVPAAVKDVSGYAAIAFRVTQHYGSAQNPGNQPQNLYVRLTDTNGKSRAIQAAVFDTIPYPYERGYTWLIKSAMNTVRIPLESYTVTNLSLPKVDLTTIQSISFEFAAWANPTGEIEIDDIQFTP